MAVHVLVPTQALPQDEASKAFVYAQCLLVNKLGHFASPSDGYRQFIHDAQKAPFCTLDASETKERDLKGVLRETANAVLQDVIPSHLASLSSTVTAFLLPKLPSSSPQALALPESTTDFTLCPATQSSPGQGLDTATGHDESKLNKLFVVTKPNKVDDEPTVIEAFFLSTAAWSPPTFEVYHLKIEVKNEQQGMIKRMAHLEQKFQISGKCNCARFSVNTSMITSFMKKKEDAEKNIVSFLFRAIKSTEIQSPSVISEPPGASLMQKLKQN